MSDIIHITSVKNRRYDATLNEPLSFFQALAQESGPRLITGRMCLDEQGIPCVEEYPHLPALVAASCLLAPVSGDVVSAVVNDGKLYVTAVLLREDSEAPLIFSGGNVPLHIVAPSLMLQGTDRVEIHTQQLSLLSRTSKWVSETLHQVTRSLFVRATNAHRKVEYTDEVEARHISQRAEHSLAVNARVGSINASAVLKIDGGQVHMG
ncbi:DUF3540 domain-containing protein [Trabulsiella odontotermitis]|uniref:DUF3540 domain-containing protein n=1 Tax=Trabulsiella odontotermitis TaxID=379893 RepID=UPI0006767B30|nr:DUF3540 domain-containing protein [Trabulsiella odontotermitis]